jgi:hypothetical protein
MPAPEIDAAPVAEEFGALARLGRLYAERLTQCHLLLLRLAADEFFEARPVTGAVRLAARRLLVEHGILTEEKA